MTAKIMNLQTELEGLKKGYEPNLQEEQDTGNDCVRIMAAQTQLAQKLTVSSDLNLKEWEFREQTHNLEDHLKKYETNMGAKGRVKL